MLYCPLKNILLTFRQFFVEGQSCVTGCSYTRSRRLFCFVWLWIWPLHLHRSPIHLELEIALVILLRGYAYQPFPLNKLLHLCYSCHASGWGWLFPALVAYDTKIFFFQSMLLRNVWRGILCFVKPYCSPVSVFCWC
jgi:hypothetical protein